MPPFRAPYARSTQSQAHRIATRSVSTTRAAMSSHSSALFNTIAGETPESQHCAKYRSSRRGLKSISSAATRNARSTFAAITCSSTRFPGAFRENTPRRGNTRCRVARSSPTISAATQSPTASGQSSPRFPHQQIPRNFPDGSAQHSPQTCQQLSTTHAAAKRRAPA